ncbi:hypothetical protein M569_09743 [Genlisea aurea]|uniref:Alpha-ketoglutarate-dependent dioxygenase AlkB-like domain-containing protein n=1 Tax=Genlisea aurea TaxID=192259 RepID=S8CK10_9LAMI|nr:hypothetical protein M569_09743 [Genlisea aurea]
MEEKKVGDMEEFVVNTIPTVLYIPQYVTAAEEFQLLNMIYQAPVSKWKSLKNRRLQNWGGIVHEKGLLPQEMPTWLRNLTDRICKDSGLFPSSINHVLINEYQPDQGIMPHQDGPAYAPVVAILSLGSSAVMDFAPHPRFSNASDSTYSGKYIPFSVALKPRSLLIFKDKAYSDYLHGIKDCEHQRYDEAVNVASFLSTDRKTEATVNVSERDDSFSISRTTTRVSLTCRVVTKVHGNIIKL